MNDICSVTKDVLIIRLNGDLDHHVAARIRENIDRSIDENRVYKLAFDFSRVNFMDSSGIGLLMGRYKKIHPVGGMIYVCNLNLQMKRIFRIFGLNEITSQNEEIDNVVNKEATYE